MQLSPERNFEAQRVALESGVHVAPFSVVLNLPTGSGKTHIAEQAIKEVVAAGQKAVYLTPLRAIANEVHQKWQNQFSAKVGIFTGEYATPPVPFAQAQVLILTPEKFEACTRNWRTHWSWISQVGVVVLDELHLLGDGRRGALLEGSISRFKRLNPFVRFMGMSATLGNPHELANWLDGIAFVDPQRPIPLIWKHLQYLKASDKPEVLLIELVAHPKQTLVFVQSRRRAEQLSQFLSDRGIPAGFHHGGMEPSERKSIEEDFRRGEHQVLVSTSTLEMGVNLPASRVILYDLQLFDGQGFVPLSTNSVWQRAGRSGRPGLDPEGEVVLMVGPLDQHPELYALGDFEPISSPLGKDRHLMEWILAEVYSGLGTTENQLARNLKHTLLFQQTPSVKLTDMIRRMHLAGLLIHKPDEAREGLMVGPLGRIACRHTLLPEGVLHLQEGTRATQGWTTFDFLLLICSTPDMEPVLPVDLEDLPVLTDLLKRQHSRILAHPPFPAWLGSGKRLLSTLTMAAVLMEGCHRGGFEHLKAPLAYYPFELRMLQEGAKRLLAALIDLDLTLKKPLEQPADVRIQDVHQMVSGLMDLDLSTLTRIPGIAAKTARKLQAHGIHHLEDLANSDPQDLKNIPGIGAERAARWIEKAEMQVKSLAWQEDSGAKIRVTDAQLPQGIDVYRFRRALELTVKKYDHITFTVRGGTDPHMVTAHPYRCDCLDHQKGHTCKHILAVRLYRNDPELLQFKAQLETHTLSSALNLVNLWTQ